MANYEEDVRRASFHKCMPRCHCSKDTARKNIKTAEAARCADAILIDPAERQYAEESMKSHQIRRRRCGRRLC